MTRDVGGADLVAWLPGLVQLFAKTLATALVEKKKLRDHEK